MKTYLIAMVALIMSAPVLGNTESGAELDLNWQDPDKFTDIRAANDSRSRFQERVKRNFEKFFQEIATDLPDGYSWQVTITDIDLAGEVDYFVTNTGQAIRVIKEIHSPAVRFNHLLRDQYGEEVVGGEERLRDMGFMSRMTPRGNSPEFEFERVMLQDWFKQELQPEITEHAALPAKVSKTQQ
ncbi:DUF3016 domain-containing protein [Arsukibacterium indicum]|uniref:DUF3016 domain-containing protein n=1 Tax=Arsukibacterium indicum TaxID=2848612 RepID=A0ABS6MPK0_9GAMM|nr:DUF3016 domain-containing protein [Arsukibacterium indicum]MBV2130753.1 DUF3016 domain-containing protein [Arsukibacterium indicum]